MAGFGDEGDGGVWLAMFLGGQVEAEQHREGSAFLSVCLVNLLSLGTLCIII